ncbi:MAG: flavin reductase family protein [Candidatus Omnitrophica bacterium]|nr:flavin reductase family protein [Candidatus Omnitrophota bacterium]
MQNDNPKFKKVEVPLKRANRLINHGPVVLVTAKYKDKTNIVTLAWTTPVSHNPPLVAICIHKDHFSTELIRGSGEFVINIPAENLLEKVQGCGTVSGREVDKFRKFSFTPLSARKVNPPLIGECLGHLECRVREIYPAGDHFLFLGEVLYAQVEEGIFGEILNIEKVKTLHHLGANFYTRPERIIKI